MTALQSKSVFNGVTPDKESYMMKMIWYHQSSLEPVTL